MMELGTTRVITRMQNHNITRQAMYVSRNIEAHSCRHCCHREAKCVTYSECVFVASVIQHAKCMPNTELTSVAFPALQYFSTLSHKQHEVLKKKKVIEHRMWF
jgi:hypothetical protein